MLHSASTSPFFPSYYAGDSSVFQAIGYFIKEFGAVPYLDAFDHKGPLMFFINALGAAFSVRTGLFCIQIISLFLSLYGIFLTAKINFSSLHAFLITFLSLFYYSTWWGNQGNTVEEYELPFIIFSLYMLLKYVLGDKNEYKPRYAFFHGITFAFCAMMRITDALSVCIGVFIVVIFLIQKKLWKNLLHNALAFILGCSLVLIPISVYFIINGAFQDFVYGTFLFNFEYASKMNLQVAHSLFEYLRVTIKMLPAFFLAFAAIISKGKILNKLLFAAIAIAHIIWMYKSNFNYQHYQIISLGFIAIGFVLIKDSYQIWKSTKYAQAFLKLSCSAFIVAVLLIASNTHFSQINWVKDKTYLHSVQKTQQLKQFVKDNVPQNELHLLTGYSIGSGFYLEAEMKPRYSYFMLLDWQMSFSESLKEKVYSAYESCEAKYILAGEILDEHIQKIIKDEYFVLSEMSSNNVVLYQKNE